MSSVTEPSTSALGKQGEMFFGLKCLLYGKQKVLSGGIVLGRIVDSGQELRMSRYQSEAVKRLGVGNYSPIKGAV